MKERKGQEAGVEKSYFPHRYPGCASPRQHRALSKSRRHGPASGPTFELTAPPGFARTAPCSPARPFAVRRRDPCHGHPGSIVGRSRPQHRHPLAGRRPLTRGDGHAVVGLAARRDGTTRLRPSHHQASSPELAGSSGFAHGAPWSGTRPGRGTAEWPVPRGGDVRSRAVGRVKVRLILPALPPRGRNHFGTHDTDDKKP